MAIAGLVLALLLGGPIAERWQDSNAHQRTIETIQAQDYAYQTAATQQARALGSNALQVFLLVGIGAARLGAARRLPQRREPIVRVERPARSRGSLSPRTTIARRSAFSPTLSAWRASRRSRPAPPTLMPASLSYGKITTVDAEQPGPACNLLVDSAPDVVMPRERWLQWIDDQPHARCSAAARGQEDDGPRNRYPPAQRGFAWWRAGYSLSTRTPGWAGPAYCRQRCEQWRELARALGGVVLAEYIARMQAQGQTQARNRGRELAMTISAD